MGFRDQKVLIAVTLSGPLLLILCIMTSRSSRHSMLVERQTSASPKQRLTLLIAVFTAFRAPERRNSIRSTWFQNCLKYRSMKCVFIQDKLDVDGNPVEYLKQMEDESIKFQNDTVIIDSVVGFNFGLRIFETIKWALQTYDFDYFLRIDDDQYLCVDRIMYELHHRTPKDFYWGYQHCRGVGNSPIDEGFLMLSSDLCREFFKNQSSLLCHRHGGVSVSLWVSQIEKMRNRTQRVIRFGDNDRIFHNPSTAEKISLIKSADLCRRYVSLHNTQPHEMIAYHAVESTRITSEFDIPPIQNSCIHAYTDMDTRNLGMASERPCESRPIIKDRWVNRAGVAVPS